MRRLIVSSLLAASLLHGPGSARAQVSAVFMKCTKSLGAAVTCVVVDAGVAKAVDIGFDQLIAIVRGGGNQVDPKQLQPSKKTVSDVEADGIAWDKLREFLESIVRSKPKASAAEIRERAQADCSVRFQPICRALGFREPRVDVTFGCDTNRTREACDKSTGCVWTGSSCRPGGTKKLLER